MSNIKCSSDPEWKLPSGQKSKNTKKRKIFSLQMENLSRGFTFTELVIVLAIFATLLSVITVSLIGIKQRSALNTSIDIFINDMRQQQLKAMIGDKESSSTTDTYGIHFATNSYVLFKGSVYDANDSQNFTINLGDNIQFVGSLPNLIFERVNGELGSSGSIPFKDMTTNSQKALQYNKFGIITAVN